MPCHRLPSKSYLQVGHFGRISSSLTSPSICQRFLFCSLMYLPSFTLFHTTFPPAFDYRAYPCQFLRRLCLTLSKLTSFSMLLNICFTITHAILDLGLPSLTIVYFTLPFR